MRINLLFNQYFETTVVSFSEIQPLKTLREEKLVLLDSKVFQQKSYVALLLNVQ